MLGMGKTSSSVVLGLRKGFLMGLLRIAWAVFLSRPRTMRELASI